MPVVFVENIYFNINIRKYESSQSEDSGAQPVGFSIAYSNPKVSNCRCQITFLSRIRGFFPRLWPLTICKITTKLANQKHILNLLRQRSLH